DRVMRHAVRGGGRELEEGGSLTAIDDCVGERRAVLAPLNVERAPHANHDVVDGAYAHGRVMVGIDVAGGVAAVTERDGPGGAGHVLEAIGLEDDVVRSAFELDSAVAAGVPVVAEVAAEREAVRAGETHREVGERAVKLVVLNGDALARLVDLQVVKAAC